MYEIPRCSAWVPGAPLLGSFLQGKAEKSSVVAPLWSAPAACGACGGASMLQTALASFPERHVRILKNFIEVVNNEKL